MTDQELLDRLRNGDQAAFDRIYERYFSPLYDKAYQRIRDKEASLDILQNLFTELWLKRGTNHIDNLAAYLHTAIRFQCYKHISKKPKAAQYLDHFDATISSPIHTDDPIREKEIAVLIERWLAALPEKRRKIFLLYYAEEQSTKKIAEDLDISQKTVQSQLYVATESLRSRLAQFLSLALLVDHLNRH